MIGALRSNAHLEGLEWIVGGPTDEGSGNRLAVLAYRHPREFGPARMARVAEVSIGDCVENVLGISVPPCLSEDRDDVLRVVGEKLLQLATGRNARLAECVTRPESGDFRVLLGEGNGTRAQASRNQP